jgi:hypothetical protein
MIILLPSEGKKELDMNRPIEPNNDTRWPTGGGGRPGYGPGYGEPEDYRDPGDGSFIPREPDDGA